MTLARWQCPIAHQVAVHQHRIGHSGATRTLAADPVGQFLTLLRVHHLDLVGVGGGGPELDDLIVGKYVHLRR